MRATVLYSSSMTRGSVAGPSVDDSQGMLYMPHKGYETAGSDDFRAEPARSDSGFATQDRVRALLDAVVSIGSDLDLEAAPRQVVEAATALVDARYGSLGVIGED